MTDTSTPTIPAGEADELRRAGAQWTEQQDGTAGHFSPDLEEVERRGHRGSQYVRVSRTTRQGFERLAPGWLQATPRATTPRTNLGKVVRRLRLIVLGRPRATRQLVHERLSKVKALAILSSDPLSSVAYATEQTLVVLLAAGSGAANWALPIMAAIAILLLIVVISYRQTIKAYPQGGGSYIVTKDNLGDNFGLIAAAALMTDYVLTVAVSVASSKDYIGAAIPWVALHPVQICVAMVVVILLGNLRGIRESGSIFAAPTYLFVVSILFMLAVAFYRIATHSVLPVTTATLPHTTEAISVFIILKAFASGCTALTGVEAISDGVPAFKPPEWKNARVTLATLGVLSITMFVGISLATHIIGLHPFANANPPIVAQLATASFGSSSFGFYMVSAATAGVLALAANTAFSDFPRLLFFLSRDSYAPRQFRHLGDRLAFSNGIILLSLLAMLLLVVFGGVVDRLIPLYTIGVFLAFTLSQLSMVTRWLRRREQGWRVGLPLNAVGAFATGVVFVVVAAVKFTEGAWVILLIVPTLVFLFRSVHKHYSAEVGTLATEIPMSPDRVKPVCVVPIAEFNRVALQSIAVARAISPTVVAVHVCDDEDHIAAVRDKWHIWGEHVPLTIIESPYRSLVRPLLSYIDSVDHQRTDDTLIVVLPELVATRWWHQLLHNQTALRLKAALLFRPGTVVVNVPHHYRRHQRHIRRHRDHVKEAI